MSVLDALTNNARLVLAPIHSLLSDIKEVHEVHDFNQRHVHAVVMHGAYSEPSTVVVEINGSPPKFTLMVDVYGLERRSDVVACVMNYGRFKTLRSDASKEGARRVALEIIKHSKTGPSWQEMWFRGDERPNKPRRDGTSPVDGLS